MKDKRITIPTGPEALEEIQKSWDDHFRENPPPPFPYVARSPVYEDEKGNLYIFGYSEYGKNK